MGGDQLQPGEEDGGTGTPTEVVAQENPKKKKTRKSKKKTDDKGALAVGYPISKPHLVVNSYNQE
jgi:hypothetical protein